MEDYSHEQIHYQTDTGMLLEIVEVSGHSVSKHWHNGFEVIFILSGSMTVNNKQ